MTNADKYLRDEVDIDDFAGEFNDFIFKQTESQSACARLVQFLKYSVKPVLTEDKRVISKEEKDAIQFLKRFIDTETFFAQDLDKILNERNLEKNIEIVLNLIDKQQKQIQDLKWRLDSLD